LVGREVVRGRLNRPQMVVLIDLGVKLC
jgi:hypothetical protein